MPLIVIEGVDCSGKETQTHTLCERLESEGKSVLHLSFPDYDSPASTPVKMYLNGDFGKNAYDVNPYAASVLFAVDRFASYKMKWQNKTDEIIVADRYVTSNVVHQASKLETNAEKEKFIHWLCDLEYDKLGLPHPDCVIFLDMPPEFAARLNAERKNKIDGGDKKDIHESNPEYLKKSYDNAVFAAKKLGWTIISCTDGERLKTIDEIADEVYTIVKERSNI